MTHIPQSRESILFSLTRTMAKENILAHLLGRSPDQVENYLFVAAVAEEKFSQEGDHFEDLEEEWVWEIVLVSKATLTDSEDSSLGLTGFCYPLSGRPETKVVQKCLSEKIIWVIQAI